MKRTWNRIFAWGMCLGLAACGGAGSDPQNPGTSPDAGTSNTGTCTLAENTVETSTVNPSGCHVLTRDTSACEAERKAQGLSGYWLHFSCRVSLSFTTTNGVKFVRAQADGQPDYKSFYFSTTNACYETYSGSIRNPNSIVAQSYIIDFPVEQDMLTQSMRGAIVGLALNGVPIFGNFAAPGDDIFTEAKTFDRCGAHPQNTGVYHYHSEPYALSYDDAHFIGVMRDGYPIYGRKDADGSAPPLDSVGGHTGVTADSPTTPVYHYHVHEQTSTNSGTLGQKQWFLTTGTYRGAPGGCIGCN
ncbi:YHYH protein [Archangium violaceum]|uniref:YHYH protein n=1 Tax=Archangium violaceum TaxID=83451 RepID=UPI002B2A94DC|nr:YHYH protein [Archangium gephyra]